MTENEVMHRQKNLRLNLSYSIASWAESYCMLCYTFQVISTLICMQLFEIGHIPRLFIRVLSEEAIYFIHKQTLYKVYNYLEITNSVSQITPLLVQHTVCIRDFLLRSFT